MILNTSPNGINSLSAPPGEIHLGTTRHTKLLETKTSMPDDLCSNIPGGIDLYSHRSHLKRTPVPMFDEILNQSWGSVIVALVAGCGHTRHVGDKMLGFWGNPHQLNQLSHKKEGG